MPKMKRVSPPMGDTPMVLSSMPMQPPSSPLSSDPSDRLATRVSPSIATQNISAGPNTTARRARGGASSSRKATPTRPPTTEAMVAAARAS